MLLISGNQPQRSHQSRPTNGCRASGRSEAESLYGRRSGGYTRRQPRRNAVSASMLSFQHVHPRKHVNACVFAVSGCMRLIRFTFPQSYRKVSLQQPFGDDVSMLLPLREQRRSSDDRSDTELSAARDSEAAPDGGLQLVPHLVLTHHIPVSRSIKSRTSCPLISTGYPA